MVWFIFCEMTPIHGWVEVLPGHFPLQPPPAPFFPPRCSPRRVASCRSHPSPRAVLVPLGPAGSGSHPNLPLASSST